jgi:uncharacterized membrane protein
MNWIVLSIVPPLIWSILNHLDKYLINKYSHHVGVGGLAIMSSLFAGLTLPFIYIANTKVLAIETSHALILSITGIFTALGILLYLYALDRDDASHVVPFWFLIPVFSYLMGVLVLQEILTVDKVIGSMIVLVGATILSLEFDQGLKIKKYTPILMIASSLFLSMNSIFFKDVATNYSFSTSLFWNQAGLLLFALILLTFFKKYRSDFISILNVNNTELGILNIVGESLQITATFISYYVILIAPVSLVLLISYCVQPLFVLIEGAVISIVFPGFIKEKINRKHIAQKILAIIVMAIGVYQIML